MAQVTSCNTQSCKYNSYGICELESIEIDCGECDMYEEED